MEPVPSYLSLTVSLWVQEQHSSRSSHLPVAGVVCVCLSVSSMASHVSVCISSGIASSPECGTALCCSSPCLAALHTPFLIPGLYTWTASNKLLPYMVMKEPRSLPLCVLAVDVLIVTSLHMCHCFVPCSVSFWNVALHGHKRA